MFIFSPDNNSDNYDWSDVFYLLMAMTVASSICISGLFVRDMKDLYCKPKADTCGRAGYEVLYDEVPNGNTTSIPTRASTASASDLRS